MPEPEAQAPVEVPIIAHKRPRGRPKGSFRKNKAQKQVEYSQRDLKTTALRNIEKNLGHLNASKQTPFNTNTAAAKKVKEDQEEMNSITKRKKRSRV